LIIAISRCCTPRIDQRLAALPDDSLAGAAPCQRPGSLPPAVGGPEPLATIAVVSPYDRLWRAAQARNAPLPEAAASVDEGVLDRVFRRVPLVTVQDGHPHTLSFLGATLHVPSVNLGVSMFGQGGSLDEVYRLQGLDHDSITGAALDLIDARTGPYRRS
jgi:hypothetical protein